MQFQTYLSILVAIAGVVGAAPAPADNADAGKTLKSRDGRFKPVWVIGLDENEEKGEHIGFRLFKDGDESKAFRMKSHGHAQTQDDEESALWYYY
ncbi:hypothetical protein CHU98_g2859 [Xylaria longipes]|nr:hypothetical protein CHU98_g2859 [Xylaria longipes]